MTHDKVRQDFEAWASDWGADLTQADNTSVFERCLTYINNETEAAFDGYRTGYQAGRAAERAEIREKLESATEGLRKVCDNFYIKGPDEDGLLWLVLHGNGTTGRALFNLGRATRIAGQVALLFEQGREAAITKILEVI